MPKRSKIKPTEINFNTPHIKPSQIDETKKVSFNFRRLQNITNKFEYHNKNTNYFNCLITRLCEVSKMSRKDFVGSIFFIVWLDPEHNLYKNKK